MAPGKPSPRRPTPRAMPQWMPRWMPRWMTRWMPRFRRFVVAEESMAPTLRPGDGLLAMRTDRIRRGEIRVFEHPRRPGFWLVKRVGHVRGAGFEAISDNRHAAAVDSRRFGDVPIAGSYRMLVRVARARRAGDATPDTRATTPGAAGGQTV